MSGTNQIADLANAYGVAGIHDISIDGLRTAVCELAQQLKEAKTLRLSAMSVYSESYSKTEWLVDDINPDMRDVWIVKSVTRLSGTDFETTGREHVLLVNRLIAPGIVDLLNSQPQSMV